MVNVSKREQRGKIEGGENKTRPAGPATKTVTSWWIGHENFESNIQSQ